MQNFLYHDLGRIAYADALERQTAVFDTLVAARRGAASSGVSTAELMNHLFFCEHEPVLTLGKSGKESNLLIPETLLKARGISFYHTNRGGDITYHGPGQITGYPIFDLEYWRIGLRTYIETLEEIVIRFLDLYGIRGERLAGATGVWIEPAVKGRARKICAIGVRSCHFITMHGFALNINTDLDYFSLINPCGFTDKGVTSLAKELGGPQDFERAKEQLRQLFVDYFPSR